MLSCDGLDVGALPSRSRGQLGLETMAQASMASMGSSWDAKPLASCPLSEVESFLLKVIGLCYSLKGTFWIIKGIIGKNKDLIVEILSLKYL